MNHRERKILRLSGYDYSAYGYYFVTICTEEMQNFFGEIRNGIMGLNQIGCAAAQCLCDIPRHFPHAFLDEWVVMPNHVHAIVIIDDDGQWVGPRHVIERPLAVGTRHALSLHNDRRHEMLPVIIGTYKSAVTKTINSMQNDLFFRWQRSYHDHIIRNETELHAIRRYIRQNPQKWELDRNHSPDFYA